LFWRYNQGVNLTEAGRSYLLIVRGALRHLEEGTRWLMAQKSGEVGTLRILVMQAFASLWLVPRLQRFHLRHPEIDVQLISWIGGISRGCNRFCPIRDRCDNSTELIGRRAAGSVGGAHSNRRRGGRCMPRSVAGEDAEDRLGSRSARIAACHHMAGNMAPMAERRWRLATEARRGDAFAAHRVYRSGGKERTWNCHGARSPRDSGVGRRPSWLHLCR